MLFTKRKKLKVLTIEQTERVLKAKKKQGYHVIRKTDILLTTIAAVPTYKKSFILWLCRWKKTHTR